MLGLATVYRLTVGVEGYWCTWSHSDTPHTVRLLWTRDRPVAENYTWQNTTLTTDIHAPGRIRTRNPGKRAATGILLFLLRVSFTAMSIAQTRQRREVGWHGVGQDFEVVVISSEYDRGICLETEECQEDIGYVVGCPGRDINSGHFPIKILWSLTSKKKLILLDPTQQVPYHSFTWRLKQIQFITLDTPALQAKVTFPAGPAQIETCANRTCACLWSNTCVCIRYVRFKPMHMCNCIYVFAYIQESPALTQTPTHWNLIGRSIAAPSFV